MTVYFVILLLFIVLAIYDHRLTKDAKETILWLCGLLLATFAAIRGQNVDFDYQNYSDLFKQTYTLSTLFSSPIDFFTVINYEPSLILINSIVKTIFGNNSFQIVIAIYAFLSVLLVTKAINQLTDLKMLSLLFFFCSYFFVQHMTQIRAAVATGFILLSIPYAVEKKTFKFVLYILLGIFFHYSAIIAFPFYFLSSKKIDKTLYFVLIVVSIILAVFSFTPFDFIANYDFGVYSDKINIYLKGKEHANFKINIFNFSIMFQLLVTSIFIIYSDKIENKYIILFTKISSWGIIVFYLFSISAALAFRTSEILNIVLIVLVPQLYYIIKPKALAEGIVILISLAYFFNQLLINPILEPYTAFF